MDIWHAKCNIIMEIDDGSFEKLVVMVKNFQLFFIYYNTFLGGEKVEEISCEP